MGVSVYLRKRVETLIVNHDLRRTSNFTADRERTEGLRMSRQIEGNFIDETLRKEPVLIDKDTQEC